MTPPRAGLLQAAAFMLLLQSASAQLTISSFSPEGMLTLSGAYPQGVVTIEKADDVTGPWFPEKNVFSTNSNAAVQLNSPAQTAFYRALAVDLSPAGGGFTNLIQSYNLLDTIAGAGQNTENEINLWEPQFEGAPATTVELSNPHIAMADRAGNVYIADKESHGILKVGTNGILITVAGNHIAGDGPDTPTPATQVSLRSPNGLRVQADGTVHIYDTLNAKVRRLDTNGIMTTLFTIPNPSFIGRGLWVSEDESLAYLCDGTVLKKWTPADGVTTLATGFFELGNLTLDHNGELVVTDRSDRTVSAGHWVWRISADGTKTAIAGNGTPTGGGSGQPALSTGLSEVRAIAFLPTGGYLLGTHRGSQVWYVDTDGIIHLFVNGFRNSISQNGDGTYFYAPNEQRVSEIRQITLDYEGNILICEHDAGNIRRIQFLRR